MSDTIDWTKRRGYDEIVCQMVSPLDLDEVWGTLSLVDGGSVSQGYYTDTRVSASVTVLDWADYIDGAWLRLVHTISGTDYARELFTGYPRSAPTSFSGIAPAAHSTTQVELKSTLYAMSEHIYSGLFTIGEGATAKQALASLCAKDGRSYQFDATATDYRYASTTCLESGESILSMCFDVCDAAGLRLDVDGHGTPVFSRYLAPSKRTSSLLLDATAANTLVIAGSVECSSDIWEMPNQAAVVYKGNGGDEDAEEEMEIYASSDLPSSHARSRAHTGVTRTELHDISDMSEPYTTAHAQKLANSYLDEDATSTTEWTCQTLWFEAEQGMVIDFDPGDGNGARKCLVKNVDSDLAGASMLHTLTLKEV